jgi:hypothetical protein
MKKEDKTKSQLTALLLIGLFFLHSPSFAEIYQWEDEQGRVHFGDELPEKNIKNSKKHAPEQAPVIIQGSGKDNERNREQASTWYEKRLQKSRIEDAQKRRDDRSNKAARKERGKKCERYKKYLSDTQQQLRAHKRAGVRPRVENKMKLRIEQYERDVKYYCS